MPHRSKINRYAFSDHHFDLEGKGARRNANRYRFLLIGAAMCALFSWQTAFADCFDDAAQYHQVNAQILRAIAWQESHSQPEAINRNTNGSTDYGLMQINSIHLKQLERYGISSDTLMRPCQSVYIGAWHLRSMMEKYGNTWQAVGAYHSQTPSRRDWYASQIINTLSRWGTLSQKDK